MRGLAICLLFAGISRASQLYLYPPPGSAPSPEHARLALSHHLGLEDFETLGGAEDAFPALFWEQKFIGRGSTNGLLLSLNEVDVQDVLPPSMPTSFSLDDPHSSEFVPMYLKRAEHAYSLIYSAAEHPTYPRSSPRVLDIFSVSSEETETFLTEVTAISDFLETKNPIERFGAFELKGLQQIGSTYGRTSEEYKLAALTINALLQSAMSNYNLHLALVTISPSTQVKRQAPPQSPLPPHMPTASPQQPIGSTCFSSAEVCGNLTDTCSGRGQCVPASKMGRTCFVCACQQTKNSKGKVESWVGQSCERKDISGPFVLITGTVIALILTIVGSVSLLYSLDSHTLPSTLTSATKKD